MRKFGDRLANAAMKDESVPRVEHIWTDTLESVPWDSAPNWNPVFVIVSYLFASSTLEINKLVERLNCLLKRLGRGPVTVLCTNSARKEFNQNFEIFSNELQKLGFNLHADDTGTIDETSGKKPIELRYALFYRETQSILLVC